MERQGEHDSYAKTARIDQTGNYVGSMLLDRFRIALCKRLKGHQGSLLQILQ
jgi:hypothetical protein